MALAALLASESCSPKAAETNVFIDPQFASLVPVDTTLLIGLRVENLVKTPVYQKYLRGKIPTIDRFSEITGIDPNKSLWNVLLISNGRKSFVLGRGKFSDELMAPDFSKKGVSRFGYRGLTMFGDEQQALLMVNSSTAAMGETATLRELIDRRSTFTGLPERVRLLTKEIPRQTQFWGVYAGGPVDVPLAGNLANVNRVLGLLGSGIFYFDLTKGVTGTVTGVAANVRDAQEAHDGLAGFLGLGRMMMPKNQPQMARALDGIQVVQDGPRVTIKVEEPEELAETLVGLMLKK